MVCSKVSRRVSRGARRTSVDPEKPLPRVSHSAKSSGPSYVTLLCTCIEDVEDLGLATTFSESFPKVKVDLLVMDGLLVSTNSAPLGCWYCEAGKKVVRTMQYR